MDQHWHIHQHEATPALLAAATSSYTDPNGNVTNQLPDWNGQGLTNVYIDALGNVASYDRIATGQSTGLATVTIDSVNRISQYVYNSQGEMTLLTNPDLTTEQYSYNSFSEATQYTDENGHVYTYTYDSKGNLLVIEDPLLNLTTMTYTADGMLATKEDANQHTTTYQYDSQDRLTTLTNPDGTTELYSYNSQGQITSMIDERGYTTTYSYDAMNRETGTTDPLHNVTTYVYDSGGNLLVDEEPTPAGQTARTTTYSYDSMNRVVTITAPMSEVTVHGYDSGGNLIKTTDPMGRVTTIAYDALNRPTVETDPLTATSNAVTTTVYDADDEVIQVTDPMGRITTTTYDNRGWVATVTDPLGNVTTYSYTNTGQIASATVQHSGSGASTSYYYDNDDRLTTVTDALGHSTSYDYDGVGNVIAVTDGNNNTTSYAYDTRNRLTTVTDALGHTTVYGYDSGGNQITVKDALAGVTTTLYDADNRATTIIDPRGDVTTMAYDAAGREIGLTDPDGNHTTWGYDAADRMTTMTDPLGNTATYVYDADKELTDTTDRDGRRVTYSYDSGGRETGETWHNSSGGTTDLITYTYDADNELTGVTDNYATLTFTYDSGGNQITAATSGPGTGQPSVTLTFGDDQSNDVTSIADNLSSQGLTTFQYDAVFRLTTITTSYSGTAGPQIVLGYDPGNRETSISRTIGGSGTQVNTTLAYDAANRLTTITDGSYTPSGSGGGTSTAIATYVYSYDNANRVTTEVNAEGTVTFTYDSGGELMTARGSRTENYSYDSGGNRNMSGYTVGTGNELLSGGGYTYTYDKEGNQTGQTQLSTGDVWTFGYDDRNRLVSAVEKNSGGTTLNQATYTYDALDHRIGIDDNSSQTWTVYDGSDADANPYADFNGSGTLLTRYVSGLAVDELFARTSSGGTTAWYLTDALGSVRDIVNTSGTVIDHIVYDSYGDILSETSPSNGDRFKFAGMEWDAAIGQYYDHARDYNSATGSFTSQDPMGFAAGNRDLYGYVGNAPTDGTDTSGMLQGGSAEYTAAYQAFYSANPNYYQWSGPQSRALTLDDVLHSVDGVCAGIAHSVTGGLTSRGRAVIYGEIATQNQSGTCFSVGAGVGAGMSLVLAFGNPCAMTRSMGAAFKGISALQGMGDGINAYDSYNNGDYLGAGMGALGLLGSASSLLQSCFAAGTPILTPEGSKPIEQFRPGDWVLAAPEDDPEAPPQPRRVEEVFENYSPIMLLTIGCQAIGTTAEHPFWVQGRGWTKAQHLMRGDRLKSHDGQWVVLGDVVSEQEAARVYNMRVGDYHTYFVGGKDWGFSVWAHNSPNCVGLIDAAQKAYPAKAMKSELHHIIPMYLGGPRSGPVKEINAAYHQVITNSFRKLAPYGTRPTAARVRQIVKQVYRDNPLPPGSSYKITQMK